MIDWSKYSTKPEADTIQDYPTIVDVIEDILEYEEQHLKLISTFLIVILKLQRYY